MSTRREFVESSLALALMCCNQASFARPGGGVGDNRGLLELSATEASKLIRNGDLSSERYAASLLAQCNRNAALNAFIWLNRDGLLEAARASDQRRSKNPGSVLRGVPIALKDNIDTTQAPTTAGTPALRGNQPRVDARVASSLFSAGALLLGKTNMHELAFGITSNNTAFGAVHNPYNSAMIPGGSSGGTAAAIAARMCPAGLGTDTGGSVRIPAALCGIVGLRTTAGRYSLEGVVPLSHTRDTVGPMARSMADLALLDAAITGDSAPIQSPRLQGLRLGVPRAYFYESLDSELAVVIESGLRRLQDAGCVLLDADFADIEKLSAISGRLSYYECMADLSSYLAGHGSTLTATEVVRQIASPDVRELYDIYVVGPKAPTLEWYQHAITYDRPALQSAYRSYFKSYNVAAMAFPTTALPARPIGQDVEVELNGKKVPTFLTYLRNARPVTSAGIPGLSIPVGLTASGLPVGLELDGPEGQDRALLGIGIAIEKLFGKLPPPGIAYA
jgi:Asp-tRNA(Asn)/Glu-tRNA(Gln) amidotransferase A subunit family amidase